MEARKTKIFTYLGFAKKSGNLCIGANSLARLKKRAYLMISCKTATDNARKDSEKFAKAFGCPLYPSGEFTLEELALKDECKTLAVTDEALANAIISVAEEYGLKLLSGGKKG